MTDTRPRGIRLNNPGNIRRGSSNWEGLAPVQADPDFCTFVTPQYGVRAICMILRSYRTKSGCDTLRKMLDRWAPPVENNTAAYLADVVQQTGLAADVRLPVVLTSEIVVPLAKAITRHENGCNPYPDLVFQTGAKLAGLSPRPQAPAAPTVVQAALASEMAA